MTGCPAPVVLVRYLAGALPPAEKGALDAHLAGCPACAEAVAEHQSLTVAAPSLPEGVTAGGELPDVPGYDILGEIHRGGQGVVYRATQRATHRVVALKVLLSGQYASPRERSRFEREVDLVAGLRHPNIVTVYDSGVTPAGLPYFAMEYIAGAPLDEYQRTAMPSREATLRLFVKVARAVHYAHQRGVIHRDLKPGNVCVDADGEPRVLDFGLAKASLPDAEAMTATGEFLGTLAYAAPEQAQGDPRLIDVRTDVYALGVMLYELLAGRRPYDLTGSLIDMLLAIVEKEPVPPSQRIARGTIDETMDAIVLKALAKRPEGRYQSAAALADDVEHYLAGEPTTARPPGLVLQTRAWLRRNLRSTVWTLVIGLLTGVFAPFGLYALRMGEAYRMLAANYQPFPSEPRPWLARVDLAALPGWLVVGLAVAGVAAFVGMGLLVQWLARPKEPIDEVVAGTATGLVCGMTMFTLYFGWATVVVVSVWPFVGEMGMLRAVAGNEAALLRRYPDLAAVPRQHRANAVFDKAVADMLLRLPAGIGYGVWLTVAWAVGVGVAGTLTGGHLRRRGEGWPPVVLHYAEVLVPVTVTAGWLIVLAGKAASAAPLAIPMPLLPVSVAFLTLTAVTSLGVFAGWRAARRFACYLLWLAVVFWAAGWGVGWPATAGPGSLVLGLAGRRRRT